MAAGTAAYGAYSSQQASKEAAGAMREGVQTFDPIRPDAPQLLDWRRAALDANNYNFNHLNDYQTMAGRINAFNIGQARYGYRRMQPYFDPLQRQIGANALAFSRGQLPEDVVASIGRAAAQRGIQSGFGGGLAGAGAGTPIANLNLRNLGLTSLDLSKFGTNLAMQANQQAAALTPALFRPESLMVSPQQAIGYEQNQINVQNEAARYWNELRNKAALGNVQGMNRANQMATETELAGNLAMSQGIAQAGSSLSGALTTYGLSQQQQQGGGFMGAPTGGAVSGYGYNPSGGYYALA